VLCPALVLSAVAAAVLALPVSAGAQTGWQTVDSSRYITQSGIPAFTVRYPPGFELKAQVQRSPVASFPGRYQTAFFVAEGRAGDVRRPFGLAVQIVEFSQEDVDVIEWAGEDVFWDTVGRTMGAKTGSFHGSRTVRHRGLLAAETLVSMDGGANRAGGRLADFSSQRYILNGTVMFSAMCMFTVPRDQALSAGAAVMNFPDVASVCRPFADSLEFRR
jgi:hypothetical protein